MDEESCCLKTQSGRASHRHRDVKGALCRVEFDDFDDGSLVGRSERVGVYMITLITAYSAIFGVIRVINDRLAQNDQSMSKGAGTGLGVWSFNTILTVT